MKPWHRGGLGPLGIKISCVNMVRTGGFHKGGNLTSLVLVSVTSQHRFCTVEESVRTLKMVT